MHSNKGDKFINRVNLKQSNPLIGAYNTESHAKAMTAATQAARRGENKKPKDNFQGVKTLSEFLNEVINVFVDLIRSFLMDKVCNSFHYNDLLQKWHIFLEPTLVYVFLHAWSIIGQVKVTHNKLNRNFYLSPSPWGVEFPISAIKRNKNAKGKISNKHAKPKCVKSL